MALTVDHAREQVSYGAGDPFMEMINRDHILGFINQAAHDIRNSGWLLRMQHVESIQLLSNEYEYDVPLNFAYVKELRLGDSTSGDASTISTGTLIDETFTDSDTTLTVDDGSIFTVNDLIQLESEILLITAISTNDLTVTRGYFGTTAASHVDDTSILRPLSDVEYNSSIPRAYWQMKTQSGGANTTTAALGDRPQFIFDKRVFSISSGTPVQVIGQRRPTVGYASGDTIDQDTESFIVERATAYAARFKYAQGQAPHMNQVYRDAMAQSRAWLMQHPQEFRVRPNSTLVPGR